jgi:hypothetical protein
MWEGDDLTRRGELEGVSVKYTLVDPTLSFSSYVITGIASLCLNFNTASYQGVTFTQCNLFYSTSR